MHALKVAVTALVLLVADMWFSIQRLMNEITAPPAEVGRTMTLNCMLFVEETPTPPVVAPAPETKTSPLRRAI